MKHTIAIDGPAASGKSSAAKLVAKRLNFSRLDSGMLYRAITYILSLEGLADKPESKAARDTIRDISIKWTNQRVTHGENDITDLLHTHEVDSKVGTVAKELHVREKVHKMQKEILEKSEDGIVVDGRDIGTVVIPDAFLKFFITASAEERARRRVKQSGGEYQAVLAEIRKRDEHDQNREHGPLKKAEDAILIDNGEMTLDETVEKMIKIYEEKCAKRQ